MAEVTKLVDDLDGTPDAERETFELLGDTYEIDLTVGNSKAVNDALDRVRRVLEVARKKPRPRTDTLFGALSAEQKVLIRKELGRPNGRIHDRDVEAWAKEVKKLPKTVD